MSTFLLILLVFILLAFILLVFILLVFVLLVSILLVFNICGNIMLLLLFLLLLYLKIVLEANAKRLDDPERPFRGYIAIDDVQFQPVGESEEQCKGFQFICLPH